MYDYGNNTASFLKQNPDLPLLVSYPRTGSHWIRMIIEHYLQKPCLPRGFVLDSATSFWANHEHDKELILRNPLGKVLYLYRNPIDVVYSEMMYERGNFDSSVDYYSSTYYKHLDRWLNTTSDIREIHYITYEDLCRNSRAAIEGVLKFLNFPLDEACLAESINFTTKSRVKKSVSHDPKALREDSNYQAKRKEFGHRYGDLISQKFKYLYERPQT